MELSAGDRVDRFVLVRQLGEGGQGAVWQVEDPLGPGESRALKLVAVNPARPNDVERVRREARALARLNHASLVQCHGLFEDLKLGVVGVVMDFVDGVSLRDAEKNPRFGQTQRTLVLKHVARVLSYLHAAGVVHRDLKLDNVLVKSAFFDAPEDAANVKVVDLGIAAVKDVPSRLTVQGTVIGTMSYLAPELLDPATFGGDESSPSIDVFAFGVLGWQLLTGEHPTGLPSGASLVDYVRAYREAATRDAWPPEPPPGEWGELLRDALSVNQERRIASGAELVARTELAPVAGVVIRPGTDAERPELAPTSVATPGAMRDPTAAVVVRGMTAASPVEAPPATEPKAPGGWLWAVIGIVAVGAVGGLLWMLFGRRDDLIPTATSASVPITSASAPSPVRPVPTVTNSPDAAGDANVETADAAPTSLPEGCDADSGSCDCCPSGQECSAGECATAIGVDQGFRLRLAEIPKNDVKLLSDTHASAEVCVKPSDVAAFTCLPIEELAHGTATAHAYATVIDLTQKGIDVVVRFELRPDVPAPLANAERVTFESITRAHVCKGLEIEMQTRHVPVPSVRLFLDPEDEHAPVPERKQCP